MKTKQQSKKAEEFRTKAELIEADLLNPDKKFTHEEVSKMTDEMRSLRARANAADEFTPEAEIDSQDGGVERPDGKKQTELLAELSPDYRADPANVSLQDRLKKAHENVVRVFGGPNRYLLRAAQQRANDSTLVYRAEERKVVDELNAIQRDMDMQARAVIGDTGGTSGGEFLLPLQQVTSIFLAQATVSGVLDIAARYPVVGRSLRIPYYDQHDATNTRPNAGIAAVGIVTESGSFTEKNPEFLQRVLYVQKWGAYVELGDETLADDMTGELSSVVTGAIGGQVINEMNGYMTIDGTGVGETQPLGALHANNGALLTVNRTTSMNITTDDIFAMYAKHTFGGGQSAWFFNRTALPELLALNLNGNALVTFVKDLQSKPQMQLLGLPLIMTDLLSVLGVAGDLALINGGFYAAAIRQGLTVESSIHYKFQNGLTAYRFYARGGGIPIPTGTYAYKSDGATKIAPHSPFVRLGDDVTS